VKIPWQPTAIPTVDVAEIRGRVFHRIKRGSKSVYRFEGNEYPTMGAAWVASIAKSFRPEAAQEAAWASNQ
jgi:hypothetical protein